MLGSHRRAAIPIDEDLSGPQLLLTASVIDAVAHCLPKQIDGDAHENVLYLAGRQLIERAIVIGIVQPNARTRRGSFQTDAPAHLDAFRKIRRFGLGLVGQIHSHPGPCVEHSDGDDEDSVIKRDGFWSLVIPDYSRSPLSVSTTGCHCFRGGAFRLLTLEAAQKRVLIVPAIL